MAILQNPDLDDSKIYVVFDKEILVKTDGSLPTAVELKEFIQNTKEADFFEEKDTGIKVLGLSEKPLSIPGYKLILLREYFYENSETEVFNSSRAKGLYAWKCSTRYCAKCGALLENSKEFTALNCPSCNKIYFPRIEPCIIVLINKGDKILLVRHKMRNQDIFACIAGFIELGESAEHAVYREVLEETGIKIKNVQYKGSQAWPFPDQLMLAYTAEYESGELCLQEEEISEAGWFSRDNIPASPKPGSVAYKLIHSLF